jgi:hypothetical protein
MSRHAPGWVPPEKLLDPGTRVRWKAKGLTGVVQHYEKEHTAYGIMPVKFEDDIWRSMVFDDVEIILRSEPEAAPAVRRRRRVA